MAMLGDVMMSADANGDMAVDGEECMMIDGEDAELKSMVCMMIVDHCDLNGDGALEGCEFLACAHLYGEEAGCIAECPCDDGENMYCMVLDYCMMNYELPVEFIEEPEEPYCICMTMDGE